MMSLTVKLSLLSMVVAIGAATPLARERRFIMDTIHNIFGTGFPVKDRNGVNKEAQEVNDISTMILDNGRWMSRTAKDFRASLYAAESDPNLDKWQTAAGLVTDLGDALEAGGDIILVHTANMLAYVSGRKKSDQPKVVFKELLDTVGDSIRWIDELLPQAKQALKELRPVAGEKSVKKDIDEVLQKVDDSTQLIVSVRPHYERLVKAAGL